MTIRTVGVLGCGLMGSGITQVSAAAGYRTVVREVDERLLDQGLTRIRQFLDAGVAKGKLTEDSRNATLANITGTTSFDAFHDCDLVIEAIVENVQAKQLAYSALERVVPQPRDSAVEHLVASASPSWRPRRSGPIDLPACISSVRFR